MHHSPVQPNCLSICVAAPEVWVPLPWRCTRTAHAQASHTSSLLPSSVQLVPSTCTIMARGCWAGPCTSCILRSVSRVCLGMHPTAMTPGALGRPILADLLRVRTSRSDTDLVSLRSYVDNMKPDQKGIYFIAADSVGAAESSPFVEQLQKRDLEVCKLLPRSDWSRPYSRGQHQSLSELPGHAGCGAPKTCFLLQLCGCHPAIQEPGRTMHSAIGQPCRHTIP